METLILTGNYKEDKEILKGEIEHITTLMGKKDFKHAVVCIDLIIQDIESLGFNLNGNKEKYYYDVFKSFSKKFSYRGT